MTLVNAGGLIRWPNFISNFSSPAIATESTLDAAGEYYCIVFQAREAMVISHVGWRGGAATGSPTADTRIETVGADGIPTGTLWATTTNIVSGTLTANTFTLHALTSSATIAKGDFFAVKIVYNSGTSFIVQRASGVSNFNANVPYRVTNVTGSAVKSQMVNGIDMALGSSTTTFYSQDNTFPMNTITVNSFANTVAGDKRGLRFKVPFACRCAGVQWYDFTSVGDYTATLFSDAGAELSSSATAFEGDRVGVSSAAVTAIFDNGVTLTPGTWYRVAIEPTSATNVSVGFVVMPSANYLSAYPHQANAHYTTFTTAGGWIDTATDSVPLMELVIDQFSDTASSGGRAVLVNPVSIIG